MKQYSPSCDQNKKPILEAIGPYLTHQKNLLEIGSGTGQHAVFFAKNLPDINWQASDQYTHLDSINSWISDENLDNTPKPIELDVSSTWPNIMFDAVFSANTTHIMSWDMVCDFFTGVGNVLESGGLFLLYGPFNYNNAYTSESNARFDLWLKQQNIQSAIRDFEKLNALAKDANMELIDDIKMPANNRTLVWKKR